MYSSIHSSNHQIELLSVYILIYYKYIDLHDIGKYVFDDQYHHHQYLYLHIFKTLQDYLTKYSGITADLLESVTITLTHVQNAIRAALPPGLFKYFFPI